MNPILSAVLIVGGLGLICSILLTVAAKLFKVEEEEIVIQIRDCLPGANCGACGYSGCDLYAKALALGKAEPHLCIPGSVTVANKLSELLCIDVKANEPMSAFVKCNGTTDAAKDKAICDFAKSCKAATSLYGGPKSCLYGCIGCGDCADVCPTDAICIKNGIAHINPKKCIGCGMCVNECPKNIISLYPRTAKIAVMCNSNDKGAIARKNCTNSCIACKKCEITCPEGAITVKDNLAEIDYNKCTACGKCKDVCPTGCIKEVDFSAPGES